MNYDIASNEENIDLYIIDTDGEYITLANVALVQKLKTLKLKTQNSFNKIDLKNIDLSEFVFEVLNDISIIEAIIQEVKSDATRVFHHINQISNNQPQRNK